MSSFFLVLQFAAAGCLIAICVAMVAVWFWALALALQHALDPWVNAGVVFFGLGFVGMAALVGLLGILWSRHLAERASSRWINWAKTAARVGTIVLTLGTMVAVVALILGVANSTIQA